MPLPTQIPVTSIIRINPAGGSEQELLAWFTVITAAAAAFDGHQGSEVLQTLQGNNTKQWINIFSFDTIEHLDAWQKSEERQRLLLQAEKLFGSKPLYQQLTGIEWWFSRPGPAVADRPSKWKMALVTSMVILVLLHTIIAWISALLMNWHFPHWFISIITVTIMICLMTWLVMPIITRALSAWLRVKK